MSDMTNIPPNLLQNLAPALAELNQDKLGLVLDFDGTLSEFVPNLENAVIHPAVVAPLRSLAKRLKMTAVMSGRAARDVERRVGIDGIAYIGNHGAERIINGALTTASRAQSTETDLQALLEILGDAAGDPGIVLENKRFSASLHYRRASDDLAVIARLRSALDDMPDAGDFEFFWGNKILEIRRRNGVNKGVALGSLIDAFQADSVIFLGDDTTDADALRCLRTRRASGEIGGFGVAVMQDGTPPSVLRSADYSLNGVPEVASFLRRLDTSLS